MISWQVFLTFSPNFLGPTEKTCHQVYRPEFATFRVEDKDNDLKTWIFRKLGPFEPKNSGAYVNNGMFVKGAGFLVVVSKNCSPLLEADFQFDKCFSDGLKPPTRDVLTEKLLRSCNVSTFLNLNWRSSAILVSTLEQWVLTKKIDGRYGTHRQVQEMVRTAWNVFTVWMCGISVDDRGDWTWLTNTIYIYVQNIS